MGSSQHFIFNEGGPWLKQDQEPQHYSWNYIFLHLFMLSQAGCLHDSHCQQFLMPQFSHPALSCTSWAVRLHICMMHRTRYFGRYAVFCFQPEYSQPNDNNKKPMLHKAWNGSRTDSISKTKPREKYLNFCFREWINICKCWSTTNFTNDDLVWFEKLQNL